MMAAVEHCDAAIAWRKRGANYWPWGGTTAFFAMGQNEELIDAGKIDDPLCLIELACVLSLAFAPDWRYDIRQSAKLGAGRTDSLFDLAVMLSASLATRYRYLPRSGRSGEDTGNLHDNFTALLKFPLGPVLAISQNAHRWNIIKRSR